MNELKKTLRDSAAARWTVLVLVSFGMLTAYYFADVMSPLKPMFQKLGGWDNNTASGFYFGAYSAFNVFLLMLIFGGIILDKMGIKFTGIAFIIIMIIGASMNYYALTPTFLNGGPGYSFFDSFLSSIFNYSASVKLAALGFAVFGVGIEIVGVTASRIIVKWFTGKSLALAMGLQVAIARLGTAAALFFAPRIAGIDEVITRPLAFGIIIMVVGLLAFLVYIMLDVKLDKEDEATATNTDDDEFKISDIGKLFVNKAFMYIAMLCVLFYGAVFPFLKFAGDFMVNKFHVPITTAGDIPSLLPFGTMILTPLFGYYLDKKGKGASIMIFGSILVIFVHLGFAFGPAQVWLAYVLIFILGVSFSLVPASMWPAVPKIVDEKYLGTAYSVIFYIQNIGLMLIPMLIGWVLDKTNPGVAQQIKNGVEGAALDYTIPMIIFAGTGFLGLFFAFLLKIEDKKKGLGLELPNIQEETV